MALTKVTQHSLGNSAVTTAKLGTAPFGFANSSANVVFMAANGSVGIGTSAPSILMHVSQSNTGGDIGLLVSQGSTGYTNTSSTATLYLGATGSLAQASRVVASRSDGTSGDHGQNLQLWTVNSGSTPTERMRIAANGNIGMGTTSPGNVLHVYKAGDGTTPFLLQTGNANGLLYFYNDSNGWSIESGGDIRFVTTRTSAGQPTRVEIRANGQLWLGKGTYGGENQKFKIGNHTLWGKFNDDFYFYGYGAETTGALLYAGNYYTFSNRKLKENIEPISNALEDILKLQGVSYNIKETGRKSIGLIADVVAPVFPDLITHDENGDPDSVDYASLTAVLIEAARDLNDKINQLKAEFDAYKASHP